MRQIPEILNTVLQAFQQDGGFGFIPKLAKPIFDAIIEAVKQQLARSAKTQGPGWAQQAQQEFKKRPQFGKDLLMNDEDPDKDLLPQPDTRTTPKP